MRPRMGVLPGVYVVKGIPEREPVFPPERDPLVFPPSLHNGKVGYRVVSGVCAKMKCQA